MKPVSGHNFFQNTFFTTQIDKPWKVLAFAVSGVAISTFGAAVISAISIPAALTVTLGTASVGYVFIKNCIQPKKTNVTLASEVECAKKDILDIIGLDNSDLTDAKSAKLFLVIKHAGNIVPKTVILSQDVNKEQILKHFEILFIDIQKDIIFNPARKTEVSIGILTKGEDFQGQPMFSYKLIAHTTAHRGETSDTGHQSANRVLASNNIQTIFCDLMGINHAPQIDAQGNFI